MPSTESFVWTCTSCGRQVPRRVDTCRCGATRRADPVVSVAAPALEPVLNRSEPPPSSAHRPLRLVLGVLRGAALAGALWFQFAMPAPQEQPEAAPGAGQARSEPGEAAVAGSESSSATDVTAVAAPDAPSVAPAALLVS